MGVISSRVLTGLAKIGLDGVSIGGLSAAHFGIASRPGASGTVGGPNVRSSSRRGEYPKGDRGRRMKAWIMCAATCALVLLLLACNSNSVDAPKPTPRLDSSPEPTQGVALNGLTKFNAANPLLVDGRDAFRICVEVIDTDLIAGGTAEDEFVLLFEQALNDATTDPRWRSGFGTPLVSLGCPLPPVALDTSKHVLNRDICRPEVSRFLVFAFIAGAESLEERFPSDVVAVVGVRRAGQEYISAPESACHRQVGEAWYLTPDDVRKPELLMDYIFGIFHIADLGR